MSHYGSLHAYPLISEDADIRGAKVFGGNPEQQEEEKLGEIRDVIFDHDTGEIRHVVVDTDGWLYSQEFLVPVEYLELLNDDTDPKHDKFYVNMTREQIQRLPKYDPSQLENAEAWSEYEKKYRQAWKEDPVLHREGSTHTITPTADELPMPEHVPDLGLPREPFVPRGIEAGPNSSGASPITLTPVTSTFDTRYSGATVGRPVGPHGVGRVPEESGEKGAENRRRPATEGFRHEPVPAMPPRGSIEEQTATPPEEFGNPATTRLGRRWVLFQSHLEENRIPIVSHCHVCGDGKKKEAA